MPLKYLTWMKSILIWQTIITFGNNITEILEYSFPILWQIHKTFHVLQSACQMLGEYYSTLYLLVVETARKSFWIAAPIKRYFHLGLFYFINGINSLW